VKKQRYRTKAEAKKEKKLRKGKNEHSADVLVFSQLLCISAS